MREPTDLLAPRSPYDWLAVNCLKCLLAVNELDQKQAKVEGQFLGRPFHYEASLYLDEVHSIREMAFDTLLLGAELNRA